MSDGKLFLIDIGCGYTFRNLVKSLLRFSNTASFYFSEDGFFYSYANPNYSVEFNFSRDKFLSFLVPDDGISFSIDLDKFSKSIQKGIKVQNMLRMFQNPADKKFCYQIISNEGMGICNYGFIQPNYNNVKPVPIPVLHRDPDRIISHTRFSEMGGKFKQNDANTIQFLAKRYKRETKLFIKPVIDGEDGYIESYEHPDLFYQDNEEELPDGTFAPVEHEEAEVYIPKSVFDRFSFDFKANQNGCVRVFVEHKKYVIFELSIDYLGYIRIMVNDVNNINKNI